MISRAKWTSSSAPKSITDPFATPSPMVASRLSTSSSAPSRTGATIVSERWYGIADAPLGAHWSKSSEKWRTLSFSQKTSPR